MSRIDVVYVRHFGSRHRHTPRSLSHRRRRSSSHPRRPHRYASHFPFFGSSIAVPMRGMQRQHIENDYGGGLTSQLVLLPRQAFLLRSHDERICNARRYVRRARV